MNAVRVVIADDHPIVRGGLRSLLESHPDMAVVAEVEDGEAAVAAVGRCRPDVVVMDISMPRLGGAEATARICGGWPAVRVLALTAHEDPAYLKKLSAAGASGYLVKRTAADDFVRAVRAVAAGATFFDPSVVPAPPTPPSGVAGADAIDLSDRETEVLRQIAAGHSNKQIAARLRISVKTVETYKARAAEKLRLRSRVDIVRYAISRGWMAGE